jgi:hypothetical protein
MLCHLPLEAEEYDRSRGPHGANHRIGGGLSFFAKGDPMRTLLRIGQAVVLGLLVGVEGRAQGGMITSFSSSGPGGTATLSIDTNPGLPPGAALAYTANFSSVAPIFITIGVDSPGQYYLTSEVSENVTNLTGEHWSAFEFILSGGPAGSRLAGASQSGPSSPNHFDIPPSFLPSPSNADIVRFSGGTGVAPGGGTSLGVTIVVGGGSGPETFQVELAASVPEPSTIVLVLSSGLFGLGGLWRRHRRRARAV